MQPQHPSNGLPAPESQGWSRNLSSPPTSPIPHRASSSLLRTGATTPSSSYSTNTGGPPFIGRLSASASSEHLRRASNYIGVNPYGVSPSPTPSSQMNGSSAASTIGGIPPGNNSLTESVLSYHLLNVIQSNDLSLILPALHDYIASTSHVIGSSPAFGSPLHLAISVCSRHVVEQIVNTFFLSGPSRNRSTLWINDQNQPDGETPLHLAAKAKNLETLDLLFRIEGIDDSVRNTQGRTAEDVVPRNDLVSEKVIELFRRERADFINKTTEKLRSLVASRSTYALFDFVSKDRRLNGYVAAGYIDINAPLDAQSLITLLHYAAREDSAELVDWCVSKGADPEIKDKKGRKPIDPIILPNSSAAPSGTSTPQVVLQPPNVKGILKKWVNYSSGWKSRFFCLEKGTFSYYKSEADYPESCRGSIATRIASIVFPDAKEKSRFDVIGKGGVRFCLQARSPADAKRWVWALMESKRWVTDQELDLNNPYNFGAGQDGQDGVSDDDLDTNGPSYDYQGSGDIPPPFGGSDSPVGSADGSPHRQSISAIHANIHRISVISTQGNQVARNSLGSRADSARMDQFPSTTTDDLATLAHLLQIQMEVQNRVIEAVVESLLLSASQPPSRLSTPSGEPRSPSAQNPNGGSFLRDIDVSNLPSLMRSSMKQVADTVGRVLVVAESKERKWRRREMKNADRVKRLETIIHSGLGAHQAGTHLNGVGPLTGGPVSTDRNLSPDKLMVSEDEFFADTTDLSPQMNTPGPLIGGQGGQVEDDSEDSDVLLDMQDAEEDPDNDIFYDAADGVAPRTFTASSKMTVRSYRSPQVKPSASLPIGAISGANAQIVRAQSLKLAPTTGPANPMESATLVAAEKVEVNRVEVTPVELLNQPSKGVVAKEDKPTVFIDASTLTASLKGHLVDSSRRTNLPLDPNKPKPAFQAWSFIKSAIGKDLSKVTLPVFFNEPISLLQRMAEDVEFAELLSVAGRIGRTKGPIYGADPAAACAKDYGFSMSDMEKLRGEEAQMGRLLFVAAYAMSNYSSTVGRTTKPFNSLLGETFELISDDKQYRYISEQVCHHPPISACYADSPDWIFWTEVYTKSKFWGASLELHPLGNCHVRLPLSDDIGGQPGETEHIVWKKVTTTVNNLIVGKLTITHLGDMVVRNLRTGDECILTFRPKQSGGSWFSWGGSGEQPAGSGAGPSSSAADVAGVGEIVGVYKDRAGNVRWNITGTWGDRLVASRVGSAPAGPKLPDSVTIWQRNPSHPLSPFFFNQTAFAMKLNELPETLRTYLPPTDARHRIDQKAMEDGMWDDANKLKEKLEVIQRGRRRVLVKEFEATGRPSGPLIPPSMPAHLRNNGGGGVSGGVGGAPLQLGEAWWNPRWFVRTIEPDTGEPHWVFTHEYWEYRAKAQWPEHVLPIYEPVPQEKDKEKEKS
ncbi:hypothetical protein HDU97_005751 [Phlyctochytrium planicorne]|nr:hypothetical protein HDU97_005751 [Phlyctochytrium planicorne]